MRVGRPASVAIALQMQTLVRATATAIRGARDPDAALREFATRLSRELQAAPPAPPSRDGAAPRAALSARQARSR
jgi:hypothetical protein